MTDPDRETPWEREEVNRLMYELYRTDRRSVDSAHELRPKCLELVRRRVREDLLLIQLGRMVTNARTA